MAEITEDVDRWTRHLWHTSQHNRMTIGLAGRIQRQVNQMREAVGLLPFGWNTAFPDAEFGECSVHVEGCRGQETHSASVTVRLDPDTEYLRAVGKYPDLPDRDGETGKGGAGDG